MEDAVRCNPTTIVYRTHTHTRESNHLAVSLSHAAAIHLPGAGMLHSLPTARSFLEASGGKTWGSEASGARAGPTCLDYGPPLPPAPAQVVLVCPKAALVLLGQDILASLLVRHRKPEVSQAPRPELYTTVAAQPASTL